MSSIAQRPRRWVITGQRQVGIQEFEFGAEPLEPGQIDVRVEYSAVSPGTECANYMALDPDVHRPGAWCAYPWVPGYAGIGRVIAAGEGVTEFAVGDRVVGLLPHASHFRCDAGDQIVAAHPQVDPSIAAYARLLAIASTTLLVLDADPLGTAGVWGLGTVGNLVAQLLKSAGYRVVGIDPVPQRRELAQACGIALTLNPTSPDFESLAAELTQGEGLDIAVDTTGQAPVTLGVPRFVRQGGQMVLMTHWRSQPEVDANAFISDIFRKGITLRGALDGSFESHRAGCAPGSEWIMAQRRKLTRLGETLAAGSLNLGPLISHRVRPEQCKEVYEGLCFDRANWWGVVVDWND